MKRIDCLFEKPTHSGVGLALLLMALGLSIVGVTVLPVVGLLLAVPVVFLAAVFLLAPRSPECTL